MQYVLMHVIKRRYKDIYIKSTLVFSNKCVFVAFRAVEMKKKAVQRISEQLMKLEVQATDREENKQIALGTSKLNYLDPRISVAW